MLLKDGLCLNRACHCNGKKIFSTVGTHHTEEHKKKIGKANKGIPRSEETRKKLSITHKGQSPWNKGIPRPEETKKKISEAHKGIHHSEETKQKISIYQKGRPAPNRIKISIEGNTFDSLKEASKYYNVSIPTISRWVKKNQHNAFYIEK